MKPTGEADGVWHFHLGKEFRVYYYVDGLTIVVIKIEHGVGVDSKVIRELRRRR